MSAPERRRVAERTTKLSMAVKLIDAVTGSDPRRERPPRFAPSEPRDEERDRPYPRVRLDGIDRTPVVNPSGYAVFLDLDPEAITTASVDGGTYYRDRSAVALPVAADPPVAEISLLPSPQYPFSSRSSFVYGHLRDDDGDPVPDASVGVRYLASKITTDGDGAYALRVVGDTVVPENETRVLRIAGQRPSLVVRHDEFARRRVSVTLPERSAVRYTLSYTGTGELTATEETDPTEGEDS